MYVDLREFEPSGGQYSVLIIKISKILTMYSASQKKGNHKSS